MLPYTFHDQSIWAKGKQSHQPKIIWFVWEGATDLLRMYMVPLKLELLTENLNQPNDIVANNDTTIFIILKLINELC